jgi:cellobiose-specific phosphotransferase system component IIB
MDVDVLTLQAYLVLIICSSHLNTSYMKRKMSQLSSSKKKEDLQGHSKVINALIQYLDNVINVLSTFKS